MASKYKCIRWAVKLTSIKPTLLQLKKAMAAVQPEERQRLLKFHFLDDIMLSLVGRLLMRKFVAENTNIPFHEVRFARDANNKPYWLQPHSHMDIALKFSISHQGDMVVLGGLVAAQVDPQSFGIGVDIAKIEHTQEKNLSEYFRIMSRLFTLDEWKYIRKAEFNEEQQLQAFMRLWALKEAYSKEQGVGVFMNLSEISFAVKSDQNLSENQPLLDTQLYVKSALQENYKFEEHFLPKKYCVALAYRNVCVPAESFKFLDFNELLVESDLESDVSINEQCCQVLAKLTKMQGIYA